MPSTASLSQPELLNSNMTHFNGSTSLPNNHIDTNSKMNHNLSDALIENHYNLNGNNNSSDDSLNNINPIPTPNNDLDILIKMERANKLVLLYFMNNYLNFIFVTPPFFYYYFILF